MRQFRCTAGGRVGGCCLVIPVAVLIELTSPDCTAQGGSGGAADVPPVPPRV